MKTTIWKALPFLLLLSCGSEPKQEEAAADNEALTEVLPGTWEVTNLRVLIATPEGIADSIYLFEVTENNWTRILQTRPMQYAFRRDNQYRLYFRDLEGNPVDSTKGIWNTFGDTLTLISPEETIQYRVKYNDRGMAEYRSLTDWDKDGAEDDQYQATLRKVSESSF